MTYQLPRTAGVQKFIPLTGDTVTIVPSDSPLVVAMINSANVLALNLVLPTGNFDGQLIRITFAGSITVLTMSSNTGGILGGLTAALVNGFVGFVWDAGNAIWRRCA